MFGMKSMYYSILLLLVAAIPSTGHRFGRVEETGTIVCHLTKAFLLYSLTGIALGHFSHS